MSSCFLCRSRVSRACVDASRAYRARIVPRAHSRVLVCVRVRGARVCVALTFGAARIHVLAFYLLFSCFSSLGVYGIARASRPHGLPLSLHPAYSTRLALGGRALAQVAYTLPSCACLHSPCAILCTHVLQLHSHTLCPTLRARALSPHSHALCGSSSHTHMHGYCTGWQCCVCAVPALFRSRVRGRASPGRAGTPVPGPLRSALLALSHRIRWRRVVLFVCGIRCRAARRLLSFRWLCG